MKHLLATAVLLSGLSGFAQAATLSYVGTSTHTLTGYDLTATTGLSNGTNIFKMRKEGDGVFLIGNADIKLTYLGKEAGNTNVFRMPTPTNAFNTSLNSVGDIHTLTNVNAGLLKFSFFDFIACLGIKNGEGKNSHTGALGVFVESARSVLLMFNDGGGDRDYDDMVVRMEVSPVPVPAALPLLASALGGLGFMARRRKAKA